MIDEELPSGMVITRIGKGHYNCTSENRLETTYSVDIEAYEGLGSCSCDNFMYRKLPAWKREGRVLRDRNRCKHLLSVRSYLLDMIIKGAQR